METQEVGQMEFGVLGPLVLWRPSARETLTAPKLRELLTLFLLTSAPVPPIQVRSVLDEACRWRDTAGPMYVAIHRLRRWLWLHGGHRLNLEPGGYRVTFAAGSSVDADRFQQMLVQSRKLSDPVERAQALISALSLWRGPVAVDASVAVRQQYAARQLERLRRQATVEMTATCLAAGLADQALPLIERAAEEAPYDEQVQSLFALSLAACGLQAEALEAIEQTRRTLAAELGIDPSQHLREAHLRILRA